MSEYTKGDSERIIRTTKSRQVFVEGSNLLGTPALLAPLYVLRPNSFLQMEKVICNRGIVAANTEGRFIESWLAAFDLGGSSIPDQVSLRARAIWQAIQFTISSISTIEWHDTTARDSEDFDKEVTISMLDPALAKIRYGIGLAARASGAITYYHMIMIRFNEFLVQRFFGNDGAMPDIDASERGETLLWEEEFASE